MKNLEWVAPLSGEYGNSLTNQNWLEIGVKVVSYDLSSLLVKPGFAFLKKLTSIREYFPWPGELFLKVNSLVSHDEFFTIRSYYDGSLIRIAETELFQLINQLKPDGFIMPSHFLEKLALSEAKIFCPLDALTPSEQSGFYLNFAEGTDFNEFLAQLKILNRPVWVSGQFNLEQMKILSNYEIEYLESCVPLQLASLGKAYSEFHCLDLLAKEMSSQHQLLDSNCICPFCSSKFTRAYMHHLLHQVPLLGQRWLCQHNAFYCQNYIQS